MLRITFILILFSSLSDLCFAQNQMGTERLNTGATSDVLENGKWQVESGFHYEGTSRGYYGQYYLQAPSVKQRYGLIKNVELRLAISSGNFFARNNGSYTSNYYVSGFEAPILGSKVQLLKPQKSKLIPQVSILTEAILKPLAAARFRSKRVRPTLQVLLANKINDKLLIGYNIGSFWDDNFYYTYDVYIQKKWGKRLLTNIEFDGYTSKPNEMRMNKGSRLYGAVAYYISDNVLGDVGLGRGVGNSPDFFFRTGLSFVLKK